MANTNNYYCEVVNSSKELSAKEKVKIKDTQDAISINAQIAEQASAVLINVDFYAKLKIHNEKATPNTDYEVVVIVDKDGQKWVTGSESFMRQFETIMDDMEDCEEEWTLKVYGRPSKNFTGRDFITCSVI